MKKIDRKITIDDLAIMVKKGFDNMGEDMNRGFGTINKRMDLLEQGHEEIKLRLDNVAYRFELVELQKRVETSEKRIGMKHR